MRLTLDELVQRARLLSVGRIQGDRLRAKASFDSIARVPRSFSGLAFLDADKITVPVVNGITAKNIYTVDATSMRAVFLNRARSAREALFARIFGGMPASTRVLNIGCGNDTAIDVAAQRSGHEILHTDASHAVIDRLAGSVGGRAFACDLSQLTDFIPPESVDVVVGNSVLGYIAINEFSGVMGNVASLMTTGGVFTYDLAPHGCYFRCIDGSLTQTCANESSPDAAVLERFQNS